MRRLLFLVAVCCLPQLSLHANAFQSEAAIEGDSHLEVTVGLTGYVKQVVLPGSELTVREVNPRRTPIALRIDKVYPHGDDFRYDLTFFGLTPGTHNLTEYLVRKDDSSADNLPQITANVTSILPSEQFAPSPPPKGFIAKIGGYYVVMILAIAGWIAGLIAILFWRKNNAQTGDAAEAVESVSEVEQIKILVDQAIDSGELSDQQKADLDMRVLNFWRARRNITDASVTDALSQLKTDDQAGPLLTGLERWFYSREAPTKEQIVVLLKPMSDIAAQEASAAPAASAAGGVS